MRILVTGISGNVGAYVAYALKDKHELVGLDVKPPASFPGIPFLKIDLMDAKAVCEAVKNFDAVAHLAAIPNPFKDPGEKVLAFNTVSTYNLLEAMKRNGVMKLVYAGSDSATGFGIRNVNLLPEYVPIDEKHPMWPHESYGMSKYFGERLCEEYSRAYGLRTVSLRFSWVWLYANAEAIGGILAGEHVDGFGSYVFPEDAASAVALAMEREAPSPFEAFFITAESTFHSIPSLEALKRYAKGAVVPVAVESYFAENPFRSIFDIGKSRRLLGFSPRFSKEDFHSGSRWEI